MEPQGVDSLFAPAVRRAGPGSVGSSRPAVSDGRGSRVARSETSAAPGKGLTGTRPADSAKALAERYMEMHRLECRDRIGDGFCDLAADGVLVDRRADEVLVLVMTKAQQKLQKASDPVTALMALGLFVSEVCGRSGKHAADLSVRAKQRLEEEKRADGQVLLGSLFGDQGKKKKVLGAGLARHRALTFKLLADTLGVVECTLERDRTKLTAWNTVQLSQVGYVVDLMHDPGALYESGSQKQVEYVRLLEPGFLNLAGTLSTQQELTGRAPRPAWHVEPVDLVYARDGKDRLGKGGFGEVFRGTWADSTVAIKVVKDRNPTDYDVLDFILEIALLSRLNHPNVMRFWRGCAEIAGGNRSLLMVTENIDRGGLSTILHGHGGPRFEADLSVPQILWLSWGIARGMQYLHACHVLHLDLKSPNVLIESSWTPKLCDFGLAKMQMAQPMDGFQTTLRGVSPIWAPPEMFDDRAETMTEKADVYSFGIVFFEVACRQLPFQEVSQRQLPKAKFEGTLPQIPEKIPPEFGSLVKTCCAHKPAARPSMSGVVARILELASSHEVNLSEVAMPLWRDDGAEEERTRREEEAAFEQLQARRNALQAEKRQLLMQLERTREQRRRLQELHLGAAVPEEATIPLVNTSPRSASNRGGEGGGSGGSKLVAARAQGANSREAGIGAAAAAAALVPQVDQKSCCAAQ